MVRTGGKPDAPDAARRPVLKRTTTAGLALAAVLSQMNGSVVLAATDEHGLSQKAVEIARPFGFPITNSMVVTWIAALCIVVFAQVATRSMKQFPDGPQNVLEWFQAQE
jgi:hypothetical protein